MSGRKNSEDEEEGSVSMTEEKGKRSMSEKEGKRTFEMDQPLQRIAPAILGLFVFYVAHDALQESVFTAPGFQFGWFMTAAEIGTMFLCAALWEGGFRDKEAVPTGVRLRYLGMLVLAIAVSQGTGSVALQYVNYPVKVAFKSCKLVPTMLFSTVLNGTRYGPLEYLATFLMCISLAMLGLADYEADEGEKQTKAGLILLGVAVCSDAVIPNLQEKLLRELHMPIHKMVLYSNLGSFGLVLAYIAATGELPAAITYLQAHPRIAGLLVCQAVCAYCGLRCYLRVIRSLSAVAGVLTTSARKVVTIVLSFALFAKPFSPRHAGSLCLLGLGVGLTILAKHRRRLV